MFNVAIAVLTLCGRNDEGAMIDLDEGVQVGGNWLKDVRFADDQGMVASNEQGLQLILNKLNESAKKYDYCRKHAGRPRKKCM